MTMVTMDLNESLGTLPSGRIVRLSDDLVSRHLRDKYIQNRDEIARQAEATKRLDLYRDRGQAHFERVIDDVFADPQVREWRKTFVKYALFQNITKRVVREMSAVYSEPAARSIAVGAKKYRDLQHEARMDRRMRHVNRMGNLLNNVLVWPDVSMGSAVIRVVTPDKFWAVANPNDPSMLAGFIIEQFHRGVLNSRATDPHYLVIDGKSFFNLDKDGRMVAESRRPHGLDFMPALLFSREENDEGLLDETSGKDLISAHEAVAPLNTMMLKHQKSGTKQAYATGDLSTTGMGQPMDEEHLLQLGEGVSLNTLDLGADPGTYITATRAVIKQVAANYGIPESVFDLSYAATSGFEIELKRTGLREIRRDQILDFRPFERELAEVQSAVLTAANHPCSFKTSGWSIDFGEVETPRDPAAMLTFWEKLEGMDLANRVEMYMHMNPEASEEDAEKAIATNRALRVERMQNFQTSNSTAFGPTDSVETAPTHADGTRLDANPEAELIAREVLGGD